MQGFCTIQASNLTLIEYPGDGPGRLEGNALKVLYFGRLRPYPQTLTRPIRLATNEHHLIGPIRESRENRMLSLRTPVGIFSTLQFILTYEWAQLS